jgi:hypothetical protein
MVLRKFILSLTKRKKRSRLLREVVIHLIVAVEESLIIMIAIETIRTMTIKPTPGGLKNKVVAVVVTATISAKRMQISIMTMEQKISMPMSSNNISLYLKGTEEDEAAILTIKDKLTNSTMRRTTKQKILTTKEERKEKNVIMAVVKDKVVAAEVTDNTRIMTTFSNRAPPRKRQVRIMELSSNNSSKGIGDLPGKRVAIDLRTVLAINTFPRKKRKRQSTLLSVLKSSSNKRNFSNRPLKSP